MLLKAAILAGGYGKRLRPLTDDKPKPLVEVGGKPIIVWQIEWLKRHGIKDLVILVGYKGNMIIDELGSGSRFGVRISYVVEENPLGTGGALKNAEHILGREDLFLLINGDIITTLNPLELVEILKKHSKAVASIAVVPLRSPYGIVKASDNGSVTSFVEKPVIPDYMINAGVYAMKPSIFEYLPERGDIERTCFPKLASEGKLLAKIYGDNVYWRSIDTIKDIEEVGNDIASGKLSF
ncbi:MAG: nucleotidyltransferase family protein [Desulfurococcales archaeon]|jgi:NDP-sugar pyrophosphorylase family protein|nr:nucleotidyltransferase family protein [Desulfurococcales archaeon]